jgi:hypothetical protein
MWKMLKEHELITKTKGFVFSFLQLESFELFQDFQFDKQYKVENKMFDDEVLL